MKQWIWTISVVSLFVGLRLVHAQAEQSRRDPFAPLPEAAGAGRISPAHEPVSVQAPMADAPELHLSGILYGSDDPIAVVNDTLITLGSRIDDHDVKGMTRNSVLLEANGATVTLSMPVRLLFRDAHLSHANASDVHYTLHTQRARIKDVLEALANQTGYNLIFTEEGENRVDLYLQQMTWEDVLQAVLQAGQLSCTRRGRVLTVIDAEEDVQTRTFVLSHANGLETQATVTQLLTGSGRVGLDRRLNTLVVTDTADNLQRIEQAIVQLDIKAPQVTIDVLIVNVTLTDELKMGVARRNNAKLRRLL